MKNIVGRISASIVKPAIVMGLMFIFFLLVLSGCGSSIRNDSVRPPTRPEASVAKNAPPAITANSGTGNKSIEGPRKIIESGQLTLETKNLNVTEAKVFDSLQKRQGLIESSSITLDSSGRRNGNYSLRIPTGKMQEFMLEIAAIPDVIVRQRSISAQDVTEEYIDITARLENMQRHEVRLREILAKANSVEEILKVEKELATVRGQIESTTGRLKSLSSKIDMSTVKLRISEVSVVTETNFGGKLVGIIRDSWIAAGDVVLYLVAAIIVLSPLTLIVLLAVWWWKRRQKTRPFPAAKVGQENEKKRSGE